MRKTGGMTMKTSIRLVPRVVGTLLALAALSVAPAQQPPAASPANCAAGRGIISAPASFRSVESDASGKVTFRLCAPDAAEVYVASTDLPGIIPFGRNEPPGLKM